MKKTGTRWGHSGVPLGGIGAGKIELCPNGRFSNVTIANNWDAPVCTSVPSLKPDRDPGGIPGSFFAAWVKGQGARILKTHPPKGTKGVTKGQISYDGYLPKAMMRFTCFKDVEIKLRAYSSLRLDNRADDHYKDSALPAAVFQLTATNTGRTKKDVSLAFSWQSTVGQGGYYRGVVSDTRDNYCKMRKGNGCIGLHFASKRKKLDPRVDGTTSLITPVADDAEITWLEGKQRFPSDAFVFTALDKNGTLPGAAEREVQGALAVKFALKPKESRTVPFVLAWWFPNLVATRNPDVNYGHAYENAFAGSWEVAEYVLANREPIQEGFHDWHRLIMRSSVPDWLRVKLVNDLFPAVSNSWYTRDYRFTINEAPTDMAGCAGTIDQRAAAQAIYAMCFPDLNKAELTLWAEQQIGADHPDRHGKHWNLKTGRFDLALDRKGAIRHDVGWDDLEGGSVERGSGWTNLHWPDTQTVFVLQCYGHYIWTGDTDWLDYIYPKLKDVLEFEARLDQDGCSERNSSGDGIADLWGTGSNTYDGDEFPWFGATPFVASLHLAALKAGEKMAGWKNDADFAAQCRAQADKVLATMENVLWDKKLGYYICWHDESFQNWRKGPRPHKKLSKSCMNAQLAGQWFAHLYDLGDILPRERIESAITQMTRRNLACVPYAMANEHYPDGRHNSSWPYYSEVYYGANAIYENEPDGGLECYEKIYKLNHEYETSPWDAVLYYGGKDNNKPVWGNSYMTNPASWFILPAIGGFAMNVPDGALTLAPNIPKKIGRGRKLEAWPIFMPQFWATIDHEQNGSTAATTFTIAKWHGGQPLRFKTITTKVPRGTQAEKATVTVTLNGKRLASKTVPVEPGSRRATLRASITLAKEGDKLTVEVQEK
jgi:non-lysosomal glucosylceramidase